MSVLFYSKNCPNCAEFLKKLREEQMLKTFDEYFCTDGRKQLPPFLHSVPTIIVSDSDKPLVGTDAFTWLTYKLNQKYKKHELGTIDNGGGNFVDLTRDPTEIPLDSENYTSIENIGKDLVVKNQAEAKFHQAESMDVGKRLAMMEQERANFATNQQGPPPPTPNFQQR